MQQTLHNKTAGSLQVRLSFRAKARGRLEMPVQLLVEHGRRLRLDLSGTCITPEAPACALPGAREPNTDGRLVLKPVAIGEMRPPLQMWSFRNAGCSMMHWALDTADLDELAAEHCGCAACGPTSPACCISGTARATSAMQSLHHHLMQSHMHPGLSTTHL